MSLQEIKSRIHQLVDAVDDETLLEEVNRVLSGQRDRDIVDDLTDEQLAGLEKARQEVRDGKGIPLAEYKKKMELATLTDLTNQQLKQLKQAIAEHKEGKTLSHEVMRDKHRKRFPTANI